jgi:Ca2+-transporting ATPase
VVPHIRRTWHSLPVHETLRTLEVQAEQGLSESEVRQRQEWFGPNELAPIRRETIGHVVLEAVTEPMILLLLAVGVLYAFWGEPWETVTVFAVIAVLVAVEVYNEWRAEQALARLNELAQPTAVVKRDGNWREVPVALLVPGDIVLLLAGRRVPADLRLLETQALAVDESVLTGESLPVEKDAEAMLSEVVPLAERKNLAFAGTLVVRGRGIGVVVAIGADTEWGRLARQTAEIRPQKTPLQQAMRELARWTVVAALGFTVLAALLAYLRELATGRQALLSALALAFATIPEELPIIITMVLALGGWRLARQRAIVRRLYAVETLGAVTVIASDKTGTITENRMTVARVEPGERERWCLELAVLCSESLPTTVSAQPTGERSWLGDPTEAALLERAQQLGLSTETTRRTGRLRQEFGFDPARKRMSTVWHIAAVSDQLSLPDRPRFFIAVKGAPERVLEICRYEWMQTPFVGCGGCDGFPVRIERTRAIADWITRHNNAVDAATVSRERTERRASTRLVECDRTVDAAAIPVLARSGGRDGPAGTAGCWRLPIAGRNANLARQRKRKATVFFVGLVGLADPPRPEAASALAECRQAGIQVWMITGDHPSTARYVARAVGFAEDTPLLTGPEIDEMSDAALQQVLQRPVLVARATPTQKLRLVQVARSAGQRVAVTGDGINDAPALRAADVGIAMGQRGSDVAREAADLILADDNFATLVHAIREGRLLFDNLSKSVRYYLACKAALVAACLTGVLVGVGIPFHPLQIILMELIMDLAASVALVAEPPEGDLMRRPPRDPQQPFLHGIVLRDLLGSAMALFLVVILTVLGTIGLASFPDGISNARAVGAGEHVAGIPDGIRNGPRGGDGGQFFRLVDRPCAAGLGVAHGSHFAG